LGSFQWAINVSGGGENLMRRELGGKYDRWDYDSDQGGGSRLAITEKRGGKGLGYILPTSYALALYASSSEGAKQDERGSEFALKRFFILSPGDIISPEINLYYERPWQIGDTTKVNNFDKGLCTNFTESDSLLAIPQEVIDANLTIPMPQNPDF
jgi:hypothetical protein